MNAPSAKGAGEGDVGVGGVRGRRQGMPRLQFAAAAHVLVVTVFVLRSRLMLVGSWPHVTVTHS